MYRNCASRSGCCSPSRTLALPCRLNPLSRSSRPDRGRRHPVPLPAQLTSQMPQRLGCPPQRRLRVASLIRLHQRQQRRDQVTVQLRDALASPAAAPHLPPGERRLTGLQLEHARADRRLADPRNLGHGPDPAMPQQPGLSSQQQSPLTLVQMRQQHLEPHRQLSRTPAGMPIPPHRTTNPEATRYFFTASVDETALAQRLGVGLLDRADQPWGTVADDQQRGSQAAVFQISQEGRPTCRRARRCPAPGR